MKKVMFVIEYKTGEQQRMVVEKNNFLSFVTKLTEKIGRGNFRILRETLTVGTVYQLPRNMILSKAE